MAQGIQSQSADPFFRFNNSPQTNQSSLMQLLGQGQGNLRSPGTQRNYAFTFQPSWRDAIGLSSSAQAGDIRTDWGDYLPQSSLRTRTRNSSAQLTSPFLGGADTAYETSGDGSGSVYGGQENQYGFGYNGEPVQIAKSGRLGLQSLGNSDRALAESTYSMSQPYQISSRDEYSNPEQGAYSSSSDTGEVRADLNTPSTRPSFMNTVSRQTGGKGETTKTYSTEGEGQGQGTGKYGVRDTSAARLGYDIGTMPIGMVANGIIPGLGGVAQAGAAALGNFLFGKKSRETNEAMANANQAQNVNTSMGLFQPGQASLNRTATTESKGYAPSGNVPAIVNASTVNTQNINQQNPAEALNLANLYSNANLAGQSYGKEDITRKKSGLFSRGYDRVSRTADAARNIAQDTGGRLALSGRSLPSAMQNIPGAMSPAIKALANQQTISKLGTGQFGGTPQTDTLTSSENMEGSVTGPASLESEVYNQGNYSNKGGLTSNMSANILGSLQGYGADISGVSNAQQALSGSMGQEAQVEASMDMNRIISNLEQQLPPSVTSQRVINTLRQNPELASLFDESNSSETQAQALASILDSQQLQAQTAINPQAQQQQQAYQYIDPYTGQPQYYANIEGQVRQINPDTLYGIDYTDPFNLQAKASLGGKTAQSGLQGQVQGRDYFYTPGSNPSSIYSQLANEVMQRSQGNWTGGNQNDALINQINQLQSQKLSDSDKQALGGLLSQKQQGLQSQISGIGSQLSGLQNTSADAVNKYINYLQSGNANQEQANDLFSQANQYTTQQKKLQDQLNQFMNTKYGYGDVLGEYQAQNNLNPANYAEQYDEQGNPIYQGHSLIDYNTILDYLNQERQYDAQSPDQKGTYQIQIGGDTYTSPNISDLVMRTTPGHVDYGPMSLPYDTSKNKVPSTVLL